MNIFSLMEKEKKVIKAVIFDMDGVLFDTESMHVQCMYEAASRLQVEITEEAVLGTLGKNLRDQKSFVMGLMESAYPLGSFPYDEHRRLHDELLEEMLRTAPPVMKGVVELLEYLKQKDIKTAVASSSKYERILFNITENGLKDYFQGFVSGEMFKHSKPAPDIYLNACEVLGVAPGEAMAIEDSKSGIMSAKAAGLLTVMVPDLIKPTEEFKPYYDLKFESLLGVLKYFEEHSL